MNWKNIKYKTWLFWILTICMLPLDAQIVYDKSNFNFGEIVPGKSTVIDFKLTNAGKTKAQIKKIEEPYGIFYRLSAKEILPDSSVFLRVKFVPKRKETFKKDIKIWIDILNEPIILTVEGTVKTPDPAATLEVPDFHTGELFTGQIFRYLELDVVDKFTRTPLPNTQILVLWDGLEYKTGKTDLMGKKLLKLPGDNFYVIFQCAGYQTEELAIDLSEQDRNVVVELTPLNMKKDSLKQDDSVTVEVESEINTDDNKEILDPNRYAPNNIVFLLDVSVSMKQQGRLDLLKTAMIELVNILRPIDKLSIVTYASETEVLLEGMPVTTKEPFIKTIQDLSAGGYTAGAKGLKKAYDICLKHFIDQGNNQIFIATDGAFNLEKGDRDLINIAEKAARKNIKISVIGVKNEKWTEKSMKQLAEISGGTYIQIKNYRDAQTVLLEEIKKHSLKY